MVFLDEVTHVSIISEVDVSAGQAFKAFAICLTSNVKAACDENKQYIQEEENQPSCAGVMILFGSTGFHVLQTKPLLVCQTPETLDQQPLNPQITCAAITWIITSQLGDSRLFSPPLSSHRQSGCEPVVEQMLKDKVVC